MFAPEAVKVEEPPVQIAAGEAEAVIVAEELTVTVTVAVPVPPLISVPVTVKVVVAAGVTEMLAPVNAPGAQA